MSTKPFSIEDCDFQGLQVNEMGKQPTPGVYDPKALTTMGMAFNAALAALPDKDRGDARRRELALLIIYLADRGETDLARLSRLAVVRMMKQGDDLSLAAWSSVSG